LSRVTIHHQQGGPISTSLLTNGPLAGLPHIDALTARSVDDEACLKEIREVLARHQRLDRFGVTLLHHHFAVAEDEIMVEECDEENRVLISRPQKVAAIDVARAIQTNWRLDADLATAKCTQVCTYNSDNEHIRSSHL